MNLKKRAILFYLVSFILSVAGIFYDKAIANAMGSFKTLWLTEIMTWLSYLGTWFFVLIFMTTLFLWQEKKRKWILPLWISLGVSLAITYFLKFAIARPRPMIPFVSSSMSFPSGHATAVFSTAEILDKEFPKLKWFWLAFSILVAFSRVYLSAHYLTDVVVGSVIGYSISLLVVYAMEKRMKNKSNQMQK